MTRVTIQTIESAPAESRPYLENARRTSGFIPNLLGVLANSPAALKTYLTVTDINNHNSLSAAQREVVQLVAATTHGCAFCVAGHSATVEKKAILAPQDLAALREGAGLADAHLQAVADFTRAVIAQRGAVSDDACQAFYAAGFTQQQALDVILGVSLATLCNFANGFAQTPLNHELRQWAWAE
ncbi:carboxymuconolactone decarboxylase family protein [Brenneria tiliae]|uniref:carboxymuconolactone decarboxylase family protein n=1 Tax=Brenneria tiliae TaxID=2914984 RepID=UPI002014871C|nr:carboxymuconolactone decarboxylase family protein [Brenneria tiliae]MCL2896900.1 carboxymuconolactone decarboxylase family protein [Brenneria tiliae]MCL2901458.1 carboxymuconolactone decarboxylase family protein [Brenneria tiliae]